MVLSMNITTLNGSLNTVIKEPEHKQKHIADIYYDEVS